MIFNPEILPENAENTSLVSSNLRTKNLAEYFIYIVLLEGKVPARVFLGTTDKKWLIETYVNESQRKSI